MVSMNPAPAVQFNPFGGSKPFDVVTDLLIPACILGMVGSFVNFIIDVRAIHLEETPVLRFVCFWFLLAIVCISRLVKKYGGAAVGGPYIAALAGALGLFLAKWSAFSQANLVLNYVLFGGAWWAIHKLTDDCTVEENVADEGEAGLLAAWKRTRPGEIGAPRRRHPGRLVLLFGLIAIATFAALQSSLASDPIAQQRAFFLLISTCFFSLALLTLTSLSGLRIYAKQRGARLPSGVPQAWITASVLVVCGLLAVAAFIPRGSGTALDVAARWFRRGESRATTGSATREGPIEGFRRAEAPSRVSARRGDTDVNRARSREGKGQEAGQSAETQTDTPGGGSNNSQSGSGGPTSSHEGGNSQTQSSGAQGASSRASSTTQTSSRSGGGSGNGESKNARGSSSGQHSGPAASLGIGAGSSWWWLLLLLLLAYVMYRWYKKNKHKIKAWLRDWRVIPVAVAEAFRNFIASIGESIARLLALLRLRSPTPVTAKPVRKKRRFTNPFEDLSLLQSLAPADLVRHTYQGILEYADLMGCPRKDQQTPIEFLRLLPAPLNPHKRDVALVTGLYVQAKYTPNALPSDHVTELSKVWETFRAEMAGALDRRR